MFAYAELGKSGKFRFLILFDSKASFQEFDYAVLTKSVDFNL